MGAQTVALADYINELQNDVDQMKRGLTKCDEKWEGFNGHFTYTE